MIVIIHQGLLIMVGKLCRYDMIAQKVRFAHMSEACDCHKAWADFLVNSIKYFKHHLWIS